MRRAIPLFLAFCSQSLFAANATFEGFARAPGSGELLYVESHFIWDAGTPLETRIVLYRCAPGGAPFARKELSYPASRIAPSFDFEDARSGYTEGLSRGADLNVFARAGTRAVRRSATLDSGAGLVADAGFDEFVREHWTALERGDALTAPFLVPSLLGSVEFRVRRIRGERVGDEPASVIRLSMSGFIGRLLPDIDVTYRDRDRLLMSYRGLTNIRDARGRLLAARIEFPEAGRGAVAPVPAMLRTLPLVDRCD